MRPRLVTAPSPPRRRAARRRLVEGKETHPDALPCPSRPSRWVTGERPWPAGHRAVARGVRVRTRAVCCVRMGLAGGPQRGMGPSVSFIYLFFIL